MELEQKRKQISCDLEFDRIPPPLFAKYPWLFTRNQEVQNDSTSGEHDLLSHQIPDELLGKHIWGCFHGWMILSDLPYNKMWYLWSPVSSNIIHLPPLFLKRKKFIDIAECCLSSPPGDPSSILMLTIERHNVQKKGKIEKHTIVYCRVHRLKRKMRSKWMEMSYTKQLKSIMPEGYDRGYLRSLTCCDSKVYALHTVCRYNHLYINIDIVVKDSDVMIRLLPCESLPYPYISRFSPTVSFLKGHLKELFYIKVGFDGVANKGIGAVHLFKLDMTSMKWKELEDLKDATFFLDFAHDHYSVSYIPVIASGLAGYVQILGKTGKAIHSYDIRNKTVSLLPIPSPVLPTSHVSLWECRLQAGDHGETKPGAPYQDEDTEDEIKLVRSVSRDYEEEVDNNNSTARIKENMESHLLNIPFEVLKMIMERCVGVEYLHFRATCKHCLLAAPMIRWSNGIGLRRLQTYSLVSPWLILFDKHRGIISFTDPMFGGKYFLETPGELIGDFQIHCSGHGWLLMRKYCGDLMFFNPFTNDIRKLPAIPYLRSYCFSAPPTSPDCMVVGFTPKLDWHVYIHFVAREGYWRRYRLDFNDASHSFHFPTFCNQKLYALCNDGGLDCFTDIGKDDFTWRKVLAKGPRNGTRFGSSSTHQSFLTQCDQHLLLVVVGEFGEAVEVFKLIENNFRYNWEKVETLGRHMIYICGSTCLCVEAKTPEMENKIYFPRSHNNNGKIVFYSLETRRYHTFNGSRNVEENLEEGFFGTKHHLNLHAWIEPSWSSS